jgi:hypothetical protein
MTYPAPHSRFAIVRTLALAFLALAASTGVVLPPLQAQIVADGASATLANVTNTITGTVTVGTNGSFTLLTLADNALLTNSAHGVIGRNATARSNEVRLVNPTARWRMGGSLFVGSNGLFSTLVVSNGASVESLDGRLGFGSASANNTALVTGPGSLWTNRGGFSVANPFLGSSTSNRLVVSDGGALVSAGAASVGGFGNRVLVTGAGSRWAGAGDFTFGGTDNQLELSAGATLVSTNAILGDIASGNTNTIALSGAGTAWTNGGNFTVGFSSSRGVLTASNGAALWFGGNASLGANSGANFNRVALADPGTRWTIGADLLLGAGSGGNLLAVGNGALLASSNAVLGSSLGASDNAALVTGAGSVWSNRNNLSVGVSGSRNQVVVSNGGTLIVRGELHLGQNGGSVSNALTVVGTGSKLLMPEPNVFLNIGSGNSSARNQFVVRDGAFAHTRYGAFLGRTVNSNDSILVSGPGTVWTNGGTLSIGSAQSSLLVTNGAEFRALSIYMGARQVGAVVTGTGSQMGVIGSVEVAGLSNRVVIEKGAAASSDELALSPGNADDAARVLVTDPGSVWSNRLHLHLSAAGGFGNELVVSNGAAVYSSNATLFGSSSVGGCEALVTGAGSAWSNRAVFRVGVTNRHSRLTLANGGALFTADLIAGEETNARSARLAVAGGMLRAVRPDATGTLEIRNGTNVFTGGLIEADRLLLTNAAGRFEFNGGTLITRGATISNGVDFVVGGSGSSPATWDVRGPSNTFVAANIYVGSNSAFNRIVLTNGAQMTNATITNVVIVGFLAGGNSNLVLLSGVGTRWSTPSLLEVGVVGASGNRLVISDGAGMTSHFNNSIGWNGSSNNEVMVTGPGSFWDRRNSSGLLIYCGNGGQNNRLIVTNGGLVASTHGYIGTLAAPCSNNFAVVTGAGSTWSNLVEIRVGDGGSASRLVVEDNGLVTAGLSCYVGFSPGSVNNRIIINNATLRATNAAADGLLEIRRGTNVLNAGLVEADILRMTNGAASRFEFNGGTLAIRSSRVSAGNPLLVGNGVNPATLHLAGNGTHDFTGTLGLILTNNAMLTGNGSLLVQLQVRPGATLSPGASVGKISLNQAPSLAGSIVMELSKTGTVTTNDQLQVTGTVTYGGALTVTHLGPAALAAADRFQLFNATAYAGSFTALTLPPLPPPLFWRDNLLVDGSIVVGAPAALALSSGSYTQNFDSLALSGGANLWRDNSTLPGWYAAQSVAPTNITDYIASDGSSVAGSLYSFGSTGSPERALGSIGSGSVGTIAYGLGFTNDTAEPQGNFLFTFTGEQWRDSSSLNTNALTFWYRVGSEAITNPEPATLTNWTQVTNLAFLTPTVTGAGAALDGNLSANRRSFASALIPDLTVAAGQTVFFRWRDVDDAGTDQGLGVDDLTVSFSALPANRFWTNALGGFYHVTSNWLAHTPPRPEDTAVFTNDASYRVTWITDELAANAHFNARGGTVTQFINQARWALTNSYVVGAGAGATAAVIHVDGELMVENDAGDARLSIGEGGQGSFVMKSGLVTVNRLLATNGMASQFTFTGGELHTEETIIDNGGTLFVGDGVSPAVLSLSGGGTHRFVDGLVVLPNGTLEGNGTIQGSVSVSGILSPGSGESQLVVTGLLGLFFTSTTVMELNLVDDLHDSIVGVDELRYGGTLQVTNRIGTLVAGDRFPLFGANVYIGSFDNLILPPLDPGLAWTNKLQVDGSIEVIVASQPGFAGISLSGTNLVFSGTNGTPGASYAVLTATNVALPASNWLSLVTNQFGANGEFSFTNAIILQEPERYFRLRTP